MLANGTPLFETEQLIVRTATVTDVELFYALWTDPQAMTNVGFPHGTRITRSGLRERLLQQGESEFEQLLVVAYQFTHTDCEAVHATPNVKNVASIKMQEAVGVIRVGEGVYHFPELLREYTTTSIACPERIGNADGPRLGLPAKLSDS